LQLKEYEAEQAHTIGAQSCCLEDTFNGETVAFRLVDTAGEERFQSLTEMSVRGAVGAILTFSLANKVSFEAIPRWYDWLRGPCPNPFLILVGNMVDLPRAVYFSEAADYAAAISAQYLETSAKTGQGVKQLLKAIVAGVAQRPKPVPDVRTREPKPATQSKGCC
jgi:small GTP-binding protein